MKIIIVLILISLVIAVTFLWLFVWSVRSGQYEDTDSPAVRILFDDKKKLRSKGSSDDELYLSNLLQLAPYKFDYHLDKSIL